MNGGSFMLGAVGQNHDDRDARQQSKLRVHLKVATADAQIGQAADVAGKRVCANSNRHADPNAFAPSVFHNPIMPHRLQVTP